MISPSAQHDAASPAKGGVIKPGIYHVKFSSSLGVGSEGLIVLKQGTVNGGDVGYIYSGTLTENMGEIIARLKIRAWNRGVISIIGRRGEFELDLRGRFSRDYAQFEVKGYALQALGLGITVRGERLGDAT